MRDAAFEQDRLQLRQDQVLQNMKQRNDDSAGIEEREWGVLLRGDDHWSNHWATASRSPRHADDLAAFQHRYVGPKNFMLAVSGDFDRADDGEEAREGVRRLAAAGRAPGPAGGAEVGATPGWYVVDKDVNQARVSIGLPRSIATIPTTPRRRS